jgi:hypothetical protein
VPQCCRPGCCWGACGVLPWRIDGTAGERKKFAELRANAYGLLNIDLKQS